MLTVTGGKFRGSTALLPTLLRIQVLMFLIAVLVIYLFDARTPGKILALATLFIVGSVVAYVHLQVRYERSAVGSAHSTPGSGH